MYKVSKKHYIWNMESHQSQMNNHFSLQRLHDMYVHKRVFYNFRCNTTFEQQMLGLLYVLFLVTMVVVLSFKAKGVRENYREAMYIGLTMGFTVCIFLVWILGGFIAPREYQVKKFSLKKITIWKLHTNGLSNRKLQF